MIYVILKQNSVSHFYVLNMRKTSDMTVEQRIAAGFHFWEDDCPER